MKSKFHSIINEKEFLTNPLRNYHKDLPLIFNFSHFGIIPFSIS